MAASNEDRVDWLILTYQLPVKPASLRTTVRRKLTAAGAIYLSSACAVAPPSAHAERTMRSARATISAAGGTAVLLVGRTLGGEIELTAAFNALCDAEYQQIIDSCRNAVAELEALTAVGEFSYPALWGKDIELRRLCAVDRAAHDRDRFGARHAQAATSALVKYRLAVDDYAKHVYAAESRP